MKLFTLKAQSREKTGKGYTKTLRRENLIPAVIYGPNSKSESIIIPVKELIQALKNKKTLELIVDITIDDKDKKMTILKELQKNQVTDEYLHADFQIIAENQELSVSIPIEVIGNPVGVDNGGLLQIIRRQLDAKCFPLKIPAKIEIDISNLDVGDSIHIEDIVKDNNDINFIYDVNFTVITCTAPKAEKEESEETEDEEVEGEETEDKKEEQATEAKAE